MINKLHFLLTTSMLTMGAIATPAWAQDASTAEELNKTDEIIVTGSRIKQDPTKSALPLQIITNTDLSREGISSPEQMIMQLSTNGNGPDNLASNADVVSGAQRGTNGLSGANLRGQGSAGTLVLLNGRRVAAHGLSGSAVDVNQIPFAAIERIEILKDGASAIYGTDAVGGVINYITKTNYQGIGATGQVDFTEQGGGNIYRVSGIAGYGDLDNQGFNIMGAVSYRWNKALRGDQRDWTSGNQPERGLSIDTRGTPIATMFPINPVTGRFPNGTLLGGTTGANILSGLLIPGTTTRAVGGINPLDLPGGAGCESMDGGMAYDWELWNAANAQYACSWDTGRAVVLQQPINTLTYYGRATANLGDHQLYAEVTGSRAKSAKRFSNAQMSGNTTNFPVAYPLNDLTRDTYNAVYNQLVQTFPAVAANYGKPIGYRWRCTICGQREYNTTAKTFRAAIGLDGPIGGGWDYRVGGSYARSRAQSTLGSGYYYRGVYAFNNPATPTVNEIGLNDPNAPTAPGAASPGLVGLLNSGILNPFSLTQTPQAIAALESISAAGETLYGGVYEVKQADASVSGSLFSLPGGEAKIAAGVDFRRESYRFDGSSAGDDLAPSIFLAAFDNANALKKANRTVKAAYAEVLLPILDILEISAAARIDDYTGFGNTVNPKVSVKFSPMDWLMLRGSYSTGFRVPSFNQIFYGRTESDTNTGANIADPLTCPTPTAPDTSPGCALITPVVVTGGNLNLGPEKSKMASVGVVLRPSPDFSASFDWWMINSDDTIALFTFRQLLQNYALFEDRFTRDASGAITEIDSTWANAGGKRTQGLEVSLRGGVDIFEDARLSMGLDGTYLLKKKERLLSNAPWSESLIGKFTYTGDLGLKWKHSAYITYSKDRFSLSLSQLFRKGYKNQALPGIAAGLITRPDYNEKVSDYVTYNMSTSYDFGGLKLTAGIRNLFDKDPPFAVTYDSLGGSGGSWEPRVADPRGRSFNLLAEVKF